MILNPFKFVEDLQSTERDGQRRISHAISLFIQGGV